MASVGRAAVFVDTKSVRGSMKTAGVVKVVMVCSGQVKGGNVALAAWATEIARFGLESILCNNPRF